MAKRVAFTVHGKVQGVFFRAFTREKAKAYNLTGWVRNAPNGVVEGEAQGDKVSLEKLLKDINQGPPAAHVTKVEESEQAVKDGESDFS